MKMETKVKTRETPFLTMNGLVKYLAAPDGGRREKVLQDFKFPNKGGGGAANYYGIARAAIREYHNSKNDSDVLMQAMDRCSTLIQTTSPEKSNKLYENMRVLKTYLAAFGHLQFRPCPQEAANVKSEGVELNLRPDMVVMEGKRTRLIRFCFRKEGATATEIKYTGQLLMLYAKHAGLDIKPSDCILLVAADGTLHSASGAMRSFDGRMRGTLREIRRLWQEL